MNSAASSSSLPPTKHKFACVRCSERKVRCDKQNPCNACIRHSVQCIFRSPKPSRRKRGLVKDELVDEQLKRYEALLREKGIDPDEVAPTSGAENPLKSTSSRSEAQETAWQLRPNATIFKPQLRHGQQGTELVDNSLWSRVAEEIHDAEGALGEDEANEASDGGTSSDGFAYVLGSQIPVPASSHPSAELFHQLWQIFLENVNPLTKLVHVPSLQPAMEKAIANIEHIPRGFEALMFAIYSMAVVSLSEDKCKEMLGESRATLLPHYVAATKAALSRARFMSSTSIVVLQALVLHILSIRDVYEPRAVWSLTGVAIRVAEGMGMRLDGKLMGLSPFESEIRRRIWWQINLHDFRAAELCGQAKFRDFKLDETTPTKPANVNDSDLYPVMPRAPVESTRPTEMVWCMLRAELATFAAAQIAKMQKLSKAALTTSEEFAAMDDLKRKDTFIQELEDTIETKILRYCDPSQPLQLLVLLGGRMSINLIQFVAHHPRRWANPWANLDRVPASEQQVVWSIVIQLLEQYSMMQSYPQLRRFAWNVPYFIQWHAVIHVLDTLRADPLHPDAVKAWRLIDTLYENNAELLLNIEKPIFVAIGSLCLKAFNARAAALAKEKRSLSDSPAYVVKLRDQREAAKARREAVSTRGKGKEIFERCGERLTTTDANAKWPTTNASSAEARVEAQMQQYPNLVQGSTCTEDDAFWFSDALGGSGTADMMDLDTDAILSQDYWLDVSNGEAIDWAQWDAWLGSMDPIRPNLSAGPG